MNTEKVFKTKTGFCHILQDRIVLTRDGVVGNVTAVTMGNNIARPLIIYGIISIGLFYFAFNNFEERQKASAFLFAFLGLFLIFGIYRSFNNSASPVIERAKIKEIKFKRAIPGVARSYFVVFFATDNGQIKRRLIMLPGSLTGGRMETAKALQIMTEEFGEIKSAG